MTDTQTLDRIKSLRSEASNFAGFHDDFAKKYTADSHCDKKGFGFGRDDRFTAFRVSTHFASWRGYYGNSGCSTVMSVRDQKLVETFIVKALNVHQREIFATVARLMREEAATLTDKAEAELARLNAMLAEAKADAPDAIEAARSDEGEIAA